MVAEYNRRCASLAASENPLGASMHAVVGDLCDPAGVAETLRGEEFFGFEMAVVGAGFHHLEHLELSVRRLVERVRKGGVVVIVDFAEGSAGWEAVLGGGGDGGDVHGDGHGHGHGHGGKSDHHHGSEDSPGKDAQSVFAAAAPSVPHKHGFSRANMESLFSAAGCTDFDYLLMQEPIVLGDGKDPVRKAWFIARGRRA